MIPILLFRKDFGPTQKDVDTWPERFQMIFSENRRGVIGGKYVSLDSRRQQRIRILKMRGSEMEGAMKRGPVRWGAEHG